MNEIGAIEILRKDMQAVITVKEREIEELRLQLQLLRGLAEDLNTSNFQANLHILNLKTKLAMAEKWVTNDRHSD